MNIYTLSNSRGLIARVTDYGAILMSLEFPDREGQLDNVVLGFETVDAYRSTEYLQNCPYFGATPGRYANRIKAGRFHLDGKDYQLAVNDRGNSLHGGLRGFDKVQWEVQPESVTSDRRIRLVYVSPDGEEGYPGELRAEVIYAVNEENELEIEWKATTNRPTVVNLTNHAYFNLSGKFGTSILEHELKLNAREFVSVDEAGIPLGNLVPVEGTPFDFCRAQRIGEAIDADDEQITNGQGYDHNFVLDRAAEGLQPAAELYHPASGRTMMIRTTQPGIQFYSGNMLDGRFHSKHGDSYKWRTALCLETQHYPDSPNQPSFPSTILRPGEYYHHSSVYRFSVR